MKKQLPDIKAPLKTRSFRVGGYSVFAVIIVIAIAIVANVLVCALPSGMTQYDITSSQLFTISEQTESILDNLDTDVTIYWVVQSGQEDTTLETLLGRYASMSSHIKLITKDPDVSPGFVEQYYSGSIYNNSLIVVSESRSTYVSYEDIYEYDYSNYYTTYTYDINFAGEGLLTSAIRYVTSDDLPKIYILTGHGEASLSDSFATAVSQQNMETEELTLLTEEAVPDDADCILIYAPQTDISEAELTMLQEYLLSGGNLLLLTDPAEDGTELPNLTALMAYYGVTAESGIVIEGDSGYYAYGTPYFLLPAYGSHTITSPLSESGYYVLLRVASGLTVSDTLPDTVSITTLLSTSDSAFSKIAGYNLTTYEKEDGDIDGAFALAVAITDSVDDDTESHIVWVSSSSLLDDSTNEMVSGGNQDLFLNALGWMCEVEDSISIHSKSLTSEYLTVDSGTASTLSMILVGLLPIGYLAIGLGMYLGRRRK